MSDWRHDYADQNLRMAQKMLEQQGEVNKAKAEVARLRQELDEARVERGRFERDIATALNVDDWEHPADLFRMVRALRLGDEEFEQVLEKHYLAYIACDHDRKLDNPQCACSLVNLGWHPTVGAAARAWVDHVLDVLRFATPDAEPAPRTWRKGDPEPDDCARVTGRDRACSHGGATAWARTERGWYCTTAHDALPQSAKSYTDWDFLVSHWGPLTEVLAEPALGVPVDTEAGSS